MAIYTTIKLYNTIRSCFRWFFIFIWT